MKQKAPPKRGLAGLRLEGYMGKEQMIEQVTELMKKMYYEDVEFFFGMIAKFAAKKGIK